MRLGLRGIGYVHPDAVAEGIAKLPILQHLSRLVPSRRDPRQEIESANGRITRNPCRPCLRICMNLRSSSVVAIDILRFTENLEYSRLPRYLQCRMRLK